MLLFKDRLAVPLLSSLLSLAIASSSLPSGPPRRSSCHIQRWQPFASPTCRRLQALRDGDRQSVPRPADEAATSRIFRHRSRKFRARMSSNYLSCVLRSVTYFAVYTPSLDILNALSSSTFGASFLDVFWMGALLLFALFALSVYSLVFWITKSHGYAILTTIISLSITEGGFVSNLQFLFPSSFLMTIFPACFYVVDRRTATAYK